MKASAARAVQAKRTSLGGSDRWLGPGCLCFDITIYMRQRAPRDHNFTLHCSSKKPPMPNLIFHHCFMHTKRDVTGRKLASTQTQSPEFMSTYVEWRNSRSEALPANRKVEVQLDVHDTKGGSVGPRGLVTFSGRTFVLWLGPRSGKLWKSELRISRGVCCCRYSFCCLKSHHLLATDGGSRPLPVPGPPRRSDPEIAFKFANSSGPSEGLWKSVLIVGLLSWLCNINF